MDGPDRHIGDAWHDRPSLVMAGLFALAMIPLSMTPVLPLIDFYNHRGALLRAGASLTFQLSETGNGAYNPSRRPDCRTNGTNTS